jgi:cytochrome c oxidase subunit I+III
VPRKPEIEEQLRRTWAPARGFPGVLAEVNNQILGVRFMVTAFVFFLLGGILALMMRVQLAVSENTWMGPQVYNELFTMHGSTMMFLFAVPFLEGLALYLLPMMIGARDVAFPRLTAYGYWVYLFGGMIFYASFLFGAVPDVGWFGYTPLSTARFTGVATDFWLLGLSLVEIAGLTAAVEIVVTILKFRAPGMTLGRMPLLVWTLLVAGLMILFAFSVLLTATMLLELDRTVETRFFDANRGGNNLLWQHLFWFFGHPEVYIMFLPASGIISMIVTTFARRPLVGYVLIVVAVVVTGFVSFGLWVHHMFAAGLPALSMTFFTAASLMIAIASGIQVFAWIATLWGSSPSLHPPFLFALGFVFLFVLGGLTGVMVAVVPFDLQVHDTYFIVAHFHYVLIGGVIFPVFAGLYYWLPKISGRQLQPTLGKVSFWLNFLGFNATFFPMHIMGFLGLPRRVYTYPRSLELDGYNVLATGGAFLMSLGVLVFLIDLAFSLWRGSRAADNPWNADSLEWSVTSPPAVYTFFHLPIVRSRHPLWDSRSPGEEPREDVFDQVPPRAVEHIRVEQRRDYGQLQQLLAGEPRQWRGTLITDAADAHPQAIQYLPGPTYVPLWTAIGTTVAAVGILSRGYIVAAFGCLFVAMAVIVWSRPPKKLLKLLEESELPEKTGIPVLASGTLATCWWGMLGFITIAASGFAALFYSYFYIRLFSPQWPQSGIARPELWLALLAYGALALSSLLQPAALSSYRSQKQDVTRIRLGGSFLFGVLFLGLQFWEWWRLDFVPQTNAYASLVYVMSGALVLAVLIGLAMNLMAQRRLFGEGTTNRVGLVLLLEMASLYAYFTGIVGVLVFATLYLSPYLL